jgi:hypothetical protein
MKKTALALLALTLGFVPTRAEDKQSESPWFPMKVGTAWDYQAGIGSKCHLEIKAHEKIGDALTARLELIKDGAVQAVENVGLTPQGICRFQFALKKGDQAITEIPKPPVLILKLPPKKGESFTVDSKAGGKTYKGTFKIDEDTITVPAGGPYKTIRVTSQELEADGLKPTVTTWYAENIGIVKQTITEGGQTINLELEKFTPGK